MLQYTQVSQKKSAQKKMTRRPQPYWNFWKVVFAGWLIRYPKTFFKIFGIPIGMGIVWIYNMIAR